MDNLTEYQILETIKEKVKTIIYRGIRKRDREPVILKVLKQEYPDLKDIARLRHEYKIMKDLALPGLVKAISLKKHKNGLALILEDFGGESLKQFLANKKLELIEFLPIAISLANSLADIHKHKIIHKDINPANIIINSQTREVKITDFGISTLLEQERQTSDNPNLLEGTLAYMSPEQTGRMNRSIDYRTDLYSLGITFYEMLTGVVPFQSNDPMELVHCHIAKTPVSLHQQNPEIPKTISDIVMKLLSKTAEQRYQTAFGLRRDLETCLNQLLNTGKIYPFTISEQDLSAQLQIPQKLYGRETEVATLMAAFDRVSQGQTEMILVAGYSGMGKTSIVQEIHKPIVRQRGFFISGKFDQYQRNVPYSALIQAFRQLIRQLLTETEDQIALWKEKLLKPLGVNGQVIIDVIPEVELIIGKQPPIPQLSPAESQNRFNLVFQDFIQVFTQPEHPLVLFLDDLQWADSASLKFIHLLMTTVDSQYLLLIGAYRDNEVSPSHPFMLTLDEIKQTEATINTISVRPVALNHVNQLIADTLHCDWGKALPLAQLCLEKTNGNPFFLNQLLQTLYVDNLIAFDSNNGTWQWDIEQIHSVDITDNVVDLTIRKIKILREKTQNLLKLIACIGNRFDLNILSIINEKSLPETAAELWEALEKGLILPLSDNYKIPLVVTQKSLLTSEKYLKFDYKFLHDRVQQAAYALIPEAERKKTHLKIGRLLKDNTSKSDLEEKLFALVNHLNKGAELIEDEREIYELAKLNLKAGKKAKDSIAYEAALKYFQKGTELLPEDGWQKDYQLTFVLYRERAECEYLCGYFQQAEQMFDLLLSQVQSNLEKAEIQSIRLVLYDNQGKFAENLRLCLKTLKLFGINISRSKREDILAEFDRELQIYRANLNRVKIADLINAPEMTEPEIQVCIRLLLNAIGSAYFTNQDLNALFGLKMMNLSIKYGNCDVSPFAYIAGGVITCSRLSEYDLGYEFGQLGLKLIDKYHNVKLAGKVFNSFSAYISHWKTAIRKNIIINRKGYQASLETGDLIFACYNSFHIILQRIVVGDHLNSILEESRKYLDSAKKIKNHVFVGVQQIYRHFIFNLQGLTQDKFSFNKDEFDEKEYVQMWIDNLFFPGIATYNILKTQILYLYGDYDRALEMARETQNTIDFISGQVNQSEYYFYYCLTLTALYPTASSEEQKEYWQILQTYQQKMKIWADNCPDNYLHKYLLVRAEISRICGKELDAIDLYDRAIESARENEYINNQAVANELAGKFWLAKGNEKIAKVYLKEAYYDYQVWGAKRKVEDLEEKYPQLLSEITQTLVGLRTTTSTTYATSSSNAVILDLTTVIKASQAISGEIKLEKLLQKLMKIVIENAGAQKGFLILNHEENLVIEAQGTVDNEEVTILQSISIESIDPDNSIPILPSTIINYVAHTQEYLVLNNAASEGQFINDPYIIATQCKSILCTPLLNQAQLRGIVYLENNLTTGAFTSERIELLNILSAQAAISIDNSRLYQTLEQRVEERTKELSQTLDVLKATQAELIFENNLLRSTEQPSTFDYQVGGSLSMDSPTYVVRSADRNLYQALKQGEFCYILNARQMGKSSLMVRMIHHLQHEGVNCGAIDMTRIGSENVTPEQWYKGFAVELWRSFGLLRKVNLKSWWHERKDLSPVQRLSQFIEEVVLVEVGQEDDAFRQNLVIFIDEIDCVLSLNFPVNDFFALIRFCYNQRNFNPEYQRLTFALLGVATPSDLISDRRRTPFNIGQAIQLEGFKEHEAQPLLRGLTEKVSNPQTILKELLAWTNGQPFLTQKLCQFIRSSSSTIPLNREAEWIENLVRTKIIDNWESQDEPEHLRTIRDRILKGEHQPTRLLAIYQQICHQGEVALVDSPEQRELILSGLVFKQEGTLRVHNRIYESIFDQSWIDRQIEALKSVRKLL